MLELWRHEVFSHFLIENISRNEQLKLYVRVNFNWFWVWRNSYQWSRVLGTCVHTQMHIHNHAHEQWNARSILEITSFFKSNAKLVLSAWSLDRWRLYAPLAIQEILPSQKNILSVKACTSGGLLFSVTQWIIKRTLTNIISWKKSFIKMNLKSMTHFLRNIKTTLI